MSASRIRVREPHSHLGLLLLCCFIAQLWAMTASWLTPALHRQLPYGFFLSIYNPAIYSIAGVLVLLICLPRLCQHYRWVLLIGFLCGFVYFLMREAAVKIGFMGWLRWSLAIAIIDIGRALVAGLITAALALIATWITRTFFFTLVAQDGTVCNQCGYLVGKTGAAVCPECGSARDISAISSRTSRLSNRLGKRPALGIAALLGATIAIHAWLLFLSHPFQVFRANYLMQETWTWTYSDQADFPEYSIAVTRAIPGEQDMVLIVQHGRSSPFAHSVLRIRLGALDEGYALEGTPRIICDVPQQSVRDVLNNGIPSELERRLVEAAHEHNWQADTAGSAEPHTIHVDFE